MRLQVIFDSVNKNKNICQKTAKSIRTILVSDAVIEAIQRQVIRLTERYQPLKDDDYIFCLEVWNSPITLASFIQIIKKYGAKTGIEKKFI